MTREGVNGERALGSSDSFVRHVCYLGSASGDGVRWATRGERRTPTHPVTQVQVSYLHLLGTDFTQIANEPNYLRQSSIVNQSRKITGQLISDVSKIRGFKFVAVGLIIRS